MPRLGVTWKLGRPLVVEGAQALEGAAAGRLEGDVLADDLVDAGTLAHEGDVLVADPAGHGPSLGRHCGAARARRAIGCRYGGTLWMWTGCGPTRPGCADGHAPQQRRLGPAAGRRHRHRGRPPAPRGADRRVRGARRGRRPDRGRARRRPRPSSAARPDQIALARVGDRGLVRGARRDRLHPAARRRRPHPRVVRRVRVERPAPPAAVAMRTGARLEFIPDGEDGCVDVDAFTRTARRRRRPRGRHPLPVAERPDQRRRGHRRRPARARTPGTSSTPASPSASCPSTSRRSAPTSSRPPAASSCAARGAPASCTRPTRALDELEPFPLDLHSATWLADGYEVQASARRFEYWEKSYAALLGLGAAIDYALDCGIEALVGADRRARRVRPRRARGRSPACTSTTADDAAAASSRSRATASPPRDLVAHIKAAGVNVSLSTPDYARRDFDAHGLDGLVRVSPHAYNTTEEIDRLLDRRRRRA